MDKHSKGFLWNVKLTYFRSTMKNGIILSLAAGALLLAGACKKSTDQKTDTSKTAANNKGKIVCTVDGKEWISDGAGKKYVVQYKDSVVAFGQDIYGNEGSLFGDTLNLSSCRLVGTDSSALVFDIVLTSAIVGNYTIVSHPSTAAGKATAYYYGKMGRVGKQYGYNSYNTSGNINITNFNDSMKLCSGTFNFTMTPKNTSNSKTPPHTVSNGVFVDVKFD